VLFYVLNCVVICIALGCSMYWIVLFYVLNCVVLCIELCWSLYWILLFYAVKCVVLCIWIMLFYVLFVSIVLFYVLFVCKCVLYYCHRVSTQLQLNVSYHIIAYFYWRNSIFLRSKKRGFLSTSPTYHYFTSYTITYVTQSDRLPETQLSDLKKHWIRPPCMYNVSSSVGPSQKYIRVKGVFL
jgi:hypothetical protein